MRIIGHLVTTASRYKSASVSVRGDTG
jgi:hypothetical protein